MPLPMTKALELYNEAAARLADPLTRPSEFELRRMLVDLKREMGNADANELGRLWLMTSVVRDRLGYFDEAIHAARNAVRALPRFAPTHIQLGIALGKSGLALEALAPLETARGLADPSLLPTVLCNIAAAHANLNRLDEAEEALSAAVHGPPPADPMDYIRMAIAASALEIEEDAVELIARYLSRVQGISRGQTPAMEIIDAAPQGLREQVTANDMLGRAVSVVRARQSAPLPEEYQVRTAIELPPDAWARFAQLAGLNP